MPTIASPSSALPRARPSGSRSGSWPAGARLALGADHRRALADATERLAEITAAAHEGDPERELVDVEVLVGRRQHLRLVDVVDGERLEDLRLDEVADARLRHDRDRHG